MARTLAEEREEKVSAKVARGNERAKKPPGEIISASASMKKNQQIGERNTKRIELS